MNIEPLETRIAPATLVNPTTVTYTDLDGDLVTVKVSKGALTEADFTFNNAFNSAGAQVLRLLDLQNDGPLSKANLTITAKRTAAGGDGRVNVGFIDASGTDLGNVTVAGDLGRIEAGDFNTTTTGLGKLSVTSMGRLGTTTQAPGGNLQTIVNGALGALMISGDLDEAIIEVSAANAADSKIGKVIIGGSIVGGAGANSGSISSIGKIASLKVGGSLRGGIGAESANVTAAKGYGAVTIGGSVIGGGGDESARLIAFGNSDIASLTIGGSVLGGSGIGSGVVGSFQGTLGPTKIGGDVRGGAAINTGQIFGGQEKMPSLTIGGSVIGTNFDSTGQISAGGFAGAIKIGGDLVGGSISGSEDTERSGFIQALRIGSIFIGGSIIAGTDTSSGDADLNATIRATIDIGSITVKGSIRGNSAVQPLISAAGKFGFSEPNMIAIKSLNVAGSVEFADILAGYNTNGNGAPFNPDAQIGSVTIGGDWIASDLVAGVVADDAFFGNGDDDPITEAGEPDALFSKIASIVIKGQVIGTPGGGPDHFGFVAQQIGSFKVGGTALPLTPGAGNDLNGLLIGFPGDVHVRELAL